MEKPIDVLLMPEAQDFIATLEENTRKKVFFNIRKTIEGLKGEWFEKMKGTDDLYEFRTLFNRQYIRLFAFWDTREGKKTLIICTHGLLKKTDKTPATEIQKAESLKNKYFGI